METLRLKGSVFSGKGGGGRFVDLTWVREQLEKKLGFSPYPGTLNIRLTAESARMKEALMRAPGVEIVPAAGYCAGKLFTASLMGLGCAVVIPEVPGYPEDVLEVISSENLRKRLNLVNGSPCEIQVMF